ncbi:hypothetical protein HCH_02461 [Hahella chejuensis KCTC 2396]|uniref:Uncharacterized protein n=1 Tax=Hahella chejuensis (strain KCTC 2396) TaxID=349521 RepID=Q2SJA6_HAHCH|nr:hypothetical protein HCH_02461 [Hahella chejuensis KCTC 2396]
MGIDQMIKGWSAPSRRFPRRVVQPPDGDLDFQAQTGRWCVDQHLYAGDLTDDLYRYSVSLLK